MCEEIYFQQIVSVIVQLNTNEHDFQKQPFADVLQNSCPYKFLKIHINTPKICNSFHFICNSYHVFRT